MCTPSRPRLKRPRSPSLEVQAWLDKDDFDDHAVRVTGCDMDYLPRTPGRAIVMDVCGQTRYVSHKLSTSFDVQCTRVCSARLPGYEVWCSTDCAVQPVNVRATALLGVPVYGPVAIVHV